MAELHYVIGDIVDADVDIVVNAANGIGWFGGLLTSTWKFHGITESINYATKGKVAGEVRRMRKIHMPGSVFFTKGYGIGKIGIIHAVTMLIPGWWTSEKTVEKLLPLIMEMAEQKGAETLALPFLGCGTGRLKKNRVEDIYEDFFASYDGNVKAFVYDLH